jgi:SagB-type dehydrogenase family enzyme
MKNRQGKKLRDFLKDDIRMETDFENSDQNLGIPAPPVEKACSPGAQKISLPDPQEWEHLGDVSVREAVAQRRSRRKFSKTPLSLSELAYLLWCTQGIRKKAGDRTLRMVPSAGNRHAFETYIAALNVAGLQQGIYRYLPLTHELVFESEPLHLSERLIEAALEQPFAGHCAVTFIWTVVPYRMEWRYREASYKVIALDAGHVCQNLYLACESIDAGTCAIAAYNQKAADRLLDVDGDDEFVVYMSPVGKQ